MYPEPDPYLMLKDDCMHGWGGLPSLGVTDTWDGSHIDGVILSPPMGVGVIYTTYALVFYFLPLMHIMTLRKVNICKYPPIGRIIILYSGVNKSPTRILL